MRVPVLTVACVLLVSTVVLAGEVRYDFAGTNLHNGVAYSGWVTLDDEVPANPTGSPDIASWTWENANGDSPIFTWHLDYDGRTWSSAEFGGWYEDVVSMERTSGGDIILSMDSLHNVSGTAPFDAFNLYLQLDLLPVGEPLEFPNGARLESFPRSTTRFWLREATGSAEFSAPITSLRTTFQTVPLPAAGWLGLVMLVGLALRRRF